MHEQLGAFLDIRVGPREYECELFAFIRDDCDGIGGYTRHDGA